MVHRDPKVQAHSGFKSHFSSIHVCVTLSFSKTGWTEPWLREPNFQDKAKLLVESWTQPLHKQTLRFGACWTSLAIFCWHYSIRVWWRSSPSSSGLWADEQKTWFAVTETRFVRVLKFFRESCPEKVNLVDSLILLAATCQATSVSSKFPTKNKNKQKNKN